MTHLIMTLMKFNPNNDSFIIIDKNRNFVHDSSIGNINVEALSFKGDLSSNERNRVINYLKLRTKDPTSKATIRENNYIFHFNKDLKHRGFGIQNDVSSKDQIRAKRLIWTSAGFSILVSGLIIYYYIHEVISPISPCKGIRADGLAATAASHAISTTNLLVNNQQSMFPDRSYGCGDDLEIKSEHRDNYEHSYDVDLIIGQDREETPYMVNPI